MINEFSFTIFTFSLLPVYTSKFQTWQFFLVKEKLACQIFLDKENLPTILHLHEQFFLAKVNLSRKNCSCKRGFNYSQRKPQNIFSCISHTTASNASLLSPFQFAVRTPRLPTFLGFPGTSLLKGSAGSREFEFFFSFTMNYLRVLVIS